MKTYIHCFLAKSPNRRIQNGVPFITNRKVPAELLKTEGEAQGFPIHPEVPCEY